MQVVLLGEGCVGKTSCVLRYVEDEFNKKHLTTLQARDGRVFNEFFNDPYRFFFSGVQKQNLFISFQNYRLFNPSIWFVRSIK